MQVKSVADGVLVDELMWEIIRDESVAALCGYISPSGTTHAIDKKSIEALLGAPAYVVA